MQLFWHKGFAETSLDDLTRAMGINRPSLYAAYGDKKTLYLRAMKRFFDLTGDRTAALFATVPSVRAGFEGFFAGAAELYTQGADGPRGCFLVCTATTPSATDPDIHAALGNTVGAIDRSLRHELARACRQGELVADAPLDTLATLLSATLHSMAIRARAGRPKAELTALADQVLSLVFDRWRPDKAC